VQRWRAVVFDLDDTLYPERDFVLGGFMAVARWAEANLGVLADAGYAGLCRLYESGVRGDTFDRWLEQHGIEPGPIVPRLVQVYREHEARLSPFPDVPGMLQRIRRGQRVGLLSDGFLDVQQRKLRALGLGHLFDAVVFADEWGRRAWKPSTTPFLAILERLDVPAVSAVYVADNPLKDFLGARQIGMSTVQVLRPGGEYARTSAPTPQHAADQVVYQLAELDRLLAPVSGEISLRGEAP
jgi:putative hydrolase of the HAD superfamily